jgi:transposase-like protein
MATRNRFKMSVEKRRRRRFSEEFKKKKVAEIESKATTIAEVSRQYEVRSDNVSRWVKKYGKGKQKPMTIVEVESDTRKLREAEQRIAELERALGQKQILLDFQDKMIELAEKHYNIDIKKNSGKKP